MSTRPVDVLILDADENQAVAAVRDLGRAGHHVSVAESFRWPKASFSRFSRTCFQYRSPRTDRRGFCDDLLAFQSRQPQRAVFLVPMTETTTLVLSEERERLEAAGFLLVLPDHAMLLAAFDKSVSGRIAAERGVDVPRSVTLTDGHVDEIDEFPLPAVVKALASNVSVDGRQVAAPRPQYAQSHARTKAVVRELAASGFPSIVQEFIEGVGVGFFALYDRGVLVKAFAHERIRDVHPTGSGSSYRKSISLDEDLRMAGTAILDTLRWHGAAMVEFKRTSTGRLVFLEVNGRLWGSLSLAIAAGAHFPQWLCSLAVGEQLDSRSEYLPNVHSRWILGDVRHVLAVLKGKPIGFPGRFPGRVETLSSLAAGLRTDRFDNFERVDPFPELGDWISALRKVLREFASRKP